jgi:hypothetical protein
MFNVLILLVMQIDDAHTAFSRWTCFTLSTLNPH